MTTQIRAWVYYSLLAVMTAVAAFLIGFLREYYLPKIEAWLMIEIEAQSQKHLPLRVWPEKVSLSFLPPRLVVENIRLLPKAPLTQYMAPAEIERAALHLSWLALLKGQVRISSIEFDGVDLSMIFASSATSSETSKKKNLPAFTFKDLQKIPVDSLEIRNFNLLARLTPLQSDLKVREGSILIENRFRSLYVDVVLPSLAVKEKGNNKSLELAFSTRLLLDEKELQLSALRLVKDQSFILASGKAPGFSHELQLSTLQLDTRAQLHLDDITRLAQWLAPQAKFPNTRGLLQIEASVLSGKTQYPQIDFKLAGENMFIDKYTLGNVRSRGKFAWPNLQLSELNLTSKALVANAKNIELGLEKPYPIQLQVLAKSFDLNQFFPALGLKQIPLFMEASGEVDCKGILDENLQLQCQPKISGGGLKIFTEGQDSKLHSLLEVDKLAADGEVLVNKDSITYRANIRVGEKSSGQSDGVIQYKNGFNINYKANQLHFADVRNLADLKFDGSVQIAGTTQGDSHAATMKLQLQGSDLWFEDYGLGATKGELSYKEGILTFRDIEGRSGDTRYTGNLSINFSKQQLFVTARLPYADLSDVRTMLSRKYLLPIEVHGSGSADIKAWGPLNPKLLSFRLISSFFRGNAAGESFDEFFFNVTSNNGNITADRIQILKASSGTTLTGSIKPDGQADLIIVGRNLRLEQSENLQKAGLDVLGQADFTMSIKGSILSPRTELHGRFSKVVLGDRPFDDSNFQLRFGANDLQGQGQFLGSLLNTEFQIPYSEEAEFKLNLDTNKIDLTNLFNIFSETARKKDFESNLSMKVKLHAARGGFWQSTGTVQIDDFFVRRGPQIMKLNSPARIVFNDGRINSNNLVIEEDGGFLKIQIDDSTQNNLTASLNAKFEVGILSILTPFLSDLRGRLAAAITFSGKFSDPLLNGSIFIENGMAKLVEFPHAFENIKADILFNNKTLSLNTLRAQLGGGDVTGDGSVLLSGRQNVPIDIKGSFKNSQVQVPEGFKTKGSGNFFIQGTKPPYTLGIRYDVSSGEITKEFADDGSQNQIKPSALLPRFVRAETTSPILLDIEVVMATPILVKNSLVNSPVKGKIQAVGLPSDLRLTGSVIPSPGGKVFFKDTPFEINSAAIEYQNEPPENPKIYLSAQSRVTENTTDEQNQEKVNEYEITLLVQGRINPAPQIQLSSQPPLTDQEIVSLLALGMTTTNLQNQSATTPATSSTGVQIGSAILQKPLGKTVKDKTGLDFIVGADDENVSSPKVTISKQFGPKLGASASRTIENNPKNDVKLEYKLNRNLSVVGSWQGKEARTDQSQETTSSSNKVGVDLEYKINFK